MIKTKFYIYFGFRGFLLFGLFGILLLATSQVYAHGGKKHGDTAFTALNALQKATKLYDKLIVSGKLSQDWETDLIRADVTVRRINGAKEHVVSFSRHIGDPKTVYFFFSSEGKYAGSNFNGD